jgi:hypothetical protein
MTTSVKGFGVIIVMLLLSMGSIKLFAQPVKSAYTQAEYLSLIADYVDKAVNIYDGKFAYSYTTNDMLEKETVTRRVDPSRPFLQSDQIVSVDGAPPSADQIKKHERLMQRRLRRRLEADRSLVNEEREREGSEKERFLAMLIPDSLKLIKQVDNLHTLEFRGMEDDRKKIYENLIGTLVLDTKNGFIKELGVRVSESFSPFIFMRINAGSFSLRFELNESGLPIQTDATWELDGHILYIRDLDRNETISWFDITQLSLPD